MAERPSSFLLRKPQRKPPERIVIICGLGRHRSPKLAEEFNQFAGKEGINHLVTAEHCGTETSPHEFCQKTVGARKLVPVDAPITADVKDLLTHFKHHRLTLPEVHPLPRQGAAISPVWKELLIDDVLGVNWRRLARKSDSNDCGR
ncbi:MAG: hypothetical protein AABW54_02740 [Candidatus Micrarchaeota archaeon]